MSASTSSSSKAATTTAAAPRTRVVTPVSSELLNIKTLDEFIELFQLKTMTKDPVWANHVLFAFFVALSLHVRDVLANEEGKQEAQWWQVAPKNPAVPSSHVPFGIGESCLAFVLDDCWLSDAFFTVHSANDAPTSSTRMLSESLWRELNLMILMENNSVEAERERQKRQAATGPTQATLIVKITDADDAASNNNGKPPSRSTAKMQNWSEIQQDVAATAPVGLPLCRFLSYGRMPAVPSAAAASSSSSSASSSSVAAASAAGASSSSSSSAAAAASSSSAKSSSSSPSPSTTAAAAAGPVYSPLVVQRSLLTAKPTWLLQIERNFISTFASRDLTLYLSSDDFATHLVPVRLRLDVFNTWKVSSFFGLLRAKSSSSSSSSSSAAAGSMLSAMVAAASSSAASTAASHGGSETTGEHESYGVSSFSATGSATATTTHYVPTAGVASMSTASLTAMIKRKMALHEARAASESVHAQQDAVLAAAFQQREQEAQAAQQAKAQYARVLEMADSGATLAATAAGQLFGKASLSQQDLMEKQAQVSGGASSSSSSSATAAAGAGAATGGGGALQYKRQSQIGASHQALLSAGGAHATATRRKSAATSR